VRAPFRYALLEQQLRSDESIGSSANTGQERPVEGSDLTPIIRSPEHAQDALFERLTGRW